MIIGSHITGNQILGGAQVGGVIRSNSTTLTVQSSIFQQNSCTLVGSAIAAKYGGSLTVEGTEDPDGDGLPNDLDEDSDGDGASDAAEGIERYLDRGGAPSRHDSKSKPDYGFGLGCVTASAQGGAAPWLTLVLALFGRRRRGCWA